MENKPYYSIGEVSKICHISRKALRFYDEIGLISPDKVCENHYRYYTREQLLLVPVIKYYKQMGFKLEEMRAFLSGSTYERLERQFVQKIAELQQLEHEIHRRYTSIGDWYDLILEAESVIANDVREVAVKYVETGNFCFMEQPFSHQYMETIINIDFTNYMESLQQETTGAIMLYFPVMSQRLQGQQTVVRIMQKTLLPSRETETMGFGGYLAAAAYHIGSHETIHETYERIFTWAMTQGYQWSDESYERYVTDYWTTRNTAQFVTEVMVKITR